MLEISLILMMSIALLSLTIISIVLFVKHLNFMYVFIEEIRENQTLLHREILELKLSGTIIGDIRDTSGIKHSKSNGNAQIDKRTQTNKKTQINDNITDLKSSEVSQEELSKLMEGKELVFKKEVSVNQGEMFIDTNIDI